MDYKKKYDEALERAKKLCGQRAITESLGYVFPELKESEDEKIRKAILTGLIDCRDAPDLGWSDFGGIFIDDCIAWLEEQKKVDIDDNDLATLENWESIVKENKEKWQLSDWFVEATSLLIQKVKRIENNENFNIKGSRTMLNACINALREVGHSHLSDWLEKQSEKTINHTDIKEKAHQIAWEASKNYDPLLSKEAWCEMAALDMASRLEEQHIDPYNGVCFDCYGHRWRVCARDNGIEIAMDGKPIRQFSYEDCEQTFGGMSALEAIKEEKVDNANKTEPKFKVGDWVILTAGELSTTLQIVNVDTNKKLYWFNDSSYLPIVDEECLHLWTIQDAKEGDVLAISWWEDDNFWEKIIILKKYHNKGVKWLYNKSCVEGYGNTFKNGKLALHEEVPYYSKTWTDNLHPATKKQRDLLFHNMKEEGYEWDADKKELKKLSNEDEKIKRLLEQRIRR